MISFPKSPRIGLLSLVLLIVGYELLSTYWSSLRDVSLPSRDIFSTTKSSSSSSSSSSADASWMWNATRDRDSHSLSDAHCAAAFPDLYKEIDRAAAFWKERRPGSKIGAENIDLKWSWDGGLRAMIYNQQLYIVSSRGLNHFGHWKQRSHATLHNIHRAIISSPEPIPNIEFTIKINDNIGLKAEHPDVAVWAFSRNISDPVMEQAWIIPDFNFWNYVGVTGSFSDFQRQAIEIGSDFDAKKDKLVWRGTTAFNAKIREALLKQTEGKPWSDVHRVDEDVQTDYRISMADHCRYKYAVHTEGTTWSGRLKYLLSCHLVTFIHPLTFYTHLYHLLEPSGPNQNYIQVKPDWSDLEEQMDFLQKNPEKALEIADKAADKFRDRYFTPAAQTCYWRQLFKVWSEASFEPDPYDYKVAADGSVEKTWRGMTYEEYIFWDKDVNP